MIFHEKTQIFLTILLTNVLTFLTILLVGPIGSLTMLPYYLILNHMRRQNQKDHLAFLSRTNPGRYRELLKKHPRHQR